MAGAIIEIKYFNTFLLKKVNNDTPTPIWNGSFGIPSALGASGSPPFLSTGYPVISGLDNEDTWVIEESRIRGGFNNTSVDFGAKAYIVEDEPVGTRRFNTLIYSGIFNSRTGVNNTNVFSVGTNLNIFQELKVSRALIDKDAIYSAEGGGTVTSSNLVIGAIQPYIGKYGISKNPESFGVYANRKYFTDRNNNVVLRLASDGITEISSYGMKDFFRDELTLSTNVSVKGKILGSYDIYSSEYVVSIQNPQLRQTDQMFSLRNNFYSVKTFDGKVNLWRHYSNNVERSSFYGADHRSSITFVFNPNPTNSKTFKTIGYEGSNGWQVDSIVSDQTGPVPIRNFIGSNFITNKDNAKLIYSYTEGEYVLTEGTAKVLQDVNTSNTVTLDIGSISGFVFAGNSVFSNEIITGTRTVVSYDSSTGVLVLNEPVLLTAGNTLSFTGEVSSSDYSSVFGSVVPPPLNKYYSGFNLKENKYVANLINNTAPSVGEVNFGKSITGIKGFYSTVKMSTDLTTNPGGEKTLFSVESNYDMNNGY